MADNRIEIDIILNDGTIARGLLKAEEQAVTSGRKIGGSLERGVKSGVGNAFSGLRTTILGLGAAFAGAFAAREVIQAASRQQDAVNQLNQSLKSAGEFSREASQDFQDFASSIQSRSIIGDEQILEVAALARNFTNTNEEAKKLTEAAVELSAATGKDLTASLEQLGKTFGGSLGRLAELVPDLKNLTAEQLKAGEATDFIIERFSGSALSQTRTFSGATQQLSNTFGDLLERVGEYITSSPALINVINKTTALFQNLTKSLPDSNFFDGAVIGVIDFTILLNNTLVPALKFVFNLFQSIFDAGKLIGSGLSTVFFGLSSVIFDNLTAPFLDFLSVAGKAVGLFNKDLGASITRTIQGVKNNISGFLKETASLSSQEVSKSFESLTKNISEGFGASGSESANKFLESLKEGIAEGSSILGSTDQGESGESGGSTSSPLAVDETSFDLIKEQTNFLTNFVIANQEFALSNRELLLSASEGIANAGSVIDTALDSAQAKFANFKGGFKDLKGAIKKDALDITGVVQNTLARGITGGIQVMTNALLNGQNAFKAFGQFTIGLLGDFMIRVGEMAIQVGIAASGVKAALSSLNPALAIAAGAVLIALGTSFKSLSSGPSGSSGGGVTRATQGGGGVSNGQIGNTNETNVVNLGETEQRGRQANIEVNIQGNVLDRRESALEIVQILEEAKFAGIEVA